MLIMRLNARAFLVVGLAKLEFLAQCSIPIVNHFAVFSYETVCEDFANLDCR